MTNKKDLTHHSLIRQLDEKFQSTYLSADEAEEKEELDETKPKFKPIFED